MRAGKRICLIITLLAVFTGLFAFGECRASAAVLDGYKLCAENKTFRLYVSEENLSVVIEDIKSGSLLYSSQENSDNSLNESWRGFMGSGFAVDFYGTRSTLAERMDAYNGKPSIKVTYNTKGFSADIFYEDKSFGLTIIVELTDKGFSASVPAKSVKETDETRLCSVYLYPMLGSTRYGEEEGYMFIPEGAGAIMSLQDNEGKYKTPYTKRIYGSNQGTTKPSGLSWNKPPTDVTMPVYGIAHTNSQTAFLAVASKGHYSSEIMAYPNGVITPFNWAAIKFIYREQYTMLTTRTQGILTSEKEPYLRDIQMDFYMLTGDNANYNGMAQAYRDSLISQGQLVKKDTGINVRVDFLGADSEKWIIFDRIVPMTTVSEMGIALKELTAEGIPNILAIYTGWQKGGLSKNYGSGDFRIEPKLGKASDIKSLQNELKNNVTLLLHQDFLLANTERYYNTSTDIMKVIGQVIAEIPTTGGAYPSMYYITPKRVLEFADAFNKEWGAAGTGVSIGSISNRLFSYYSQGGVHSRGDTAESFLKAVNKLSDGKTAALDQPFDYLYGDTDIYLNMPLYTSNYNYITAEIPFLPMVLKSYIPYYAEYVNFQPNERNFFLKMVEYGAFPSFIIASGSVEDLRNTNSNHIYSASLEVFKPLIKKYSDELSGVYNKTDGSAITRHTVLKTDVVLVEYANGCKILINYTNSSYSDNNGTAAALSYTIIN